MALQNCRNTNKVKYSFCFNLRPRNPKKKFGQESNIQRLALIGLPPSKRIYTQIMGYITSKIKKVL
jgi:hypothetical protein